MARIDPDSGRKIDALFARLPSFSRPICEQLRVLVHREVPDVVEDWKWGNPNFNRQGMLCGIWPFKSFVSLVFFRGARLDDPHGLLAHASGNEHNRTIKFSSAEQIESESIGGLLRAAARLNEEHPAQADGRPISK